MTKSKKGAFGKKAARGGGRGGGGGGGGGGFGRGALGGGFASNARNSPVSGLGERSRKWAGDANYASYLGLGNTSMQELARNTANKPAHWDKSSRLRDQPVSFISGGFIDPLKDSVEPEVLPSSDTVTDAATDAGTDAATDVVSVAITETSKIAAVNTPSSISTIVVAASVSSGKRAVDTPQGTSDAESSSGDEVILFRGRSNFKNTAPSPSKPPVSSTPSVPKKLEPPDRLEHLLVASDDEGGSDAAIDDYIANMLLDDMEDDTMQHTKTNKRELGGLDNDIVVFPDERGGKPSSGSASGPDRDGLESASTDLSDENDSGGDDEDEGDTEEGEDDDDDDDDDEDEDEDGDGDEDEDLDATWQLSTEIDDEQLARLLAKQEELGLGSDELVLLDGESAQTVSTQQPGHSRKQSKRSKRSAALKQKQLSGVADFTQGFKTRGRSYPSAEAVADAFEHLDMSGWDNHRGGFPLELSDSELEATLKASWQKDRQRKKEKKKAREELRAQGLLGKHANPNDPLVKYPDGIRLDDIKVEFRSFLLGSENSVTLPPMDPHARKIIHELALRFNLKSKSTGSGNQRRPTLIRTKATFQYNEDHFQASFARMSRRYFARPGSGKNAGGGRNRAGGGGGGPLGRRGENDAAATVRHGEVVGGSAPEIGQTNKGRTLLEKMGWSMGMALGAMDNQGITQPIEHVIKRSKAGLG
ncbi:Single-stranded nucleic acid binding R3H [Niveomyces insectorum RCEF 264]|uniref:Protein SQS1 n=1 Tax=Niveomyces insectorum RCEF 264 TaxID=1081102 RepID=A0A167MKV3_9HYPO|nr:Single-stranded nucleic acid binding R3H [Niveomyces insectorum RCEF 264]